MHVTSIATPLGGSHGPHPVPKPPKSVPAAPLGGSHGPHPAPKPPKSAGVDQP